MLAIYFITPIFVGITIYLVLSMIRKQKQDKQKYDEILDNSSEFQLKAKTKHHNPSKTNPV